MIQRHAIQNEKMMLVTTNTFNREPIFANDVYAREAIECLYRVKQLHPFFLYGFVIMPDHCHFLLYVPEPQAISKIMNSFKSGLIFDLGLRKRIWQPRFHIEIVEDPKVALNYIHNNPVKEDMVGSPKEYPWSSASGKWDVENL